MATIRERADQWETQISALKTELAEAKTELAEARDKPGKSAGAVTELAAQVADLKSSLEEAQAALTTLKEQQATSLPKREEENHSPATLTGTSSGTTPTAEPQTRATKTGWL